MRIEGQDMCHVGLRRREDCGIGRGKSMYATPELLTAQSSFPTSPRRLGIGPKRDEFA